MPHSNGADLPYNDISTGKCMDLLNLLSSDSVTPIWVTGHCGVEGNEKADKVARFGSESELPNVVPNIQGPISDGELRRGALIPKASFLDHPIDGQRITQYQER